MAFSQDEQFTLLRQRMAESQLRARGIKDQRVLDAMAHVPRHAFVAERFQDRAYEDHPLPIGEEQTISQPFIVALMLEMLALAPGDHVLEVGTGSGYVTAILAELSAEVISVERHTSLATRARETLDTLGYKNVTVIVADGSLGYSPDAPYDAILVSAAAPTLPSALVPQLAEGGRLVIPVGPAATQQLQFVRVQDGRPQTQFRELCRFVPLVSGSGV